MNATPEGLPSEDDENHKRSAEAPRTRPQGSQAQRRDEPIVAISSNTASADNEPSMTKEKVKSKKTPPGE
jgi:hypothetical protein